jgi:hypothetical protein
VRRGIELLDCISLFLSLGPRVVVALERNEDDEREQDRECRADHAEDGTGPVDVGVETTGGRAPANQVHARDQDADSPTRTSAATGSVMLRFSPFAPAPTSCDDFADPSEQVVRFAAL